MTPDVNEQHIIHKLFLDTIDPNDLTFERRVLPTNGRWMSDTTVTNMINSHPEVWLMMLLSIKSKNEGKLNPRTQFSHLISG